MAYAFRSSRVVLPSGIQPAALLVEEGVILRICAPDDLPGDVQVRDFGSTAILPGLIDAHTHINEPGRTEWEGFVTATRAAAAGGFTTVVDMPLNCLPETTTVEALQQKRLAAQGKCHIDWLPWGGVTGPDEDTSNLAHLVPLARAGVPGYKCFLIYPGCEGLTHITLQQLERALPTLAQLQLPLLVHAELEGPILSASQKLYDTHADWRDYKTYLASRPDEAELQAIRALIELCRTYKFRLHIVHLATALALPEVAAAKAEGLPLTVETCPHYLHLTAEQIPYAATQCKCAPPIRSEANREALWQGLRDGIIDLIATDHSPCLPEMKQAEIPEDNGRFDKSWGGIASLSTALPVVWTEAQRRGFTLEDIARWLSEAPAKLAGIHAQAGSIEVGKFANLTLFDPEAHFIVTPEKLHYRHPISPYMGETLRGEVKATVLHGEIIYENQIFPGDPKGRDLSGEPR